VSVWRTRLRSRSAEPGPAERRDVLPSLPLSAAFRQYVQGSYDEVDMSSAEAPLQVVAVHAATDLIAGIGSELPAHVYRGSGQDRRQLTMPSWLEDPDGSGHGVEDWSYRVLMSWLLRGNAYGDVLQRSTAGYLQQVALFHPDSVTPQARDGGVVWFVNGREIDSAAFLHRRVNPLPGALLGLSPISRLEATVSLPATVTRFGLQWFRDGAHPNALLTNSETPLSQEQADTVKARFLAALRGTREPVVFGKGWAYQALQIAPEESQFLETQKYSAAECARIFGPGIAEVLGYESGGSLTYANVQDRGVHLLTYSVGKWLRRLERLLSAFLPRPQYVKLDRDALLETSTMQRYLAHQSALQNGWRTVNEVRGDEDMSPVPWGDQPLALANAPEPTDPSQPEDGNEE
jgi:HK97 family phage portal protein